jgi:hypothetical protein
MGSASYRARWLRREDGIDPFIYWPEWDLLEVEDNLEAFPDDPSFPSGEDDEAEGGYLRSERDASAVRASLVKQLRAMDDPTERILAWLETMLGDDGGDPRWDGLDLVVAPTQRDASWGALAGTARHRGTARGRALTRWNWHPRRLR